MTVCVSWRTNNKVMVCSDSRYSYQGGFADIGAKIFAIPVRIKLYHQSPLNPETFYNSKIGMAFAGDVTEAILIKDLLQALLSNGTYLDLYSSKDITFVADLAKSIAQYFSTNMLNGMGIGLKFTIYLIAKAIDSDYEHCFKLEKLQNNKTVTCNEILNSTEDFDCAGDSLPENEMQTRLNQIYSNGNPLGHQPIEILRNVISSQNFQSIGGEVQSGEIRNGHFGIIGGIDASKVAPGMHVPHFVMGLDTNDPQFKSQLPDFNYTGSYFDFT